MRQHFLAIAFSIVASALLPWNAVRAQEAPELTPCDLLSPYNPDVDCNGFINFQDFNSFLALWNTNFEPDTALLALQDPDPTNELQWLAIDGDTLRLMMPDSTTVFSSLYIGGADGADGMSAYDLWLDVGNEGTVEDFLMSLMGADGAVGPQGEQGPAGADGAQGPQGEQGPAGADGAQGPQGEQGLAGADGAQGPQGEQGPQGANGMDGMSAYEVWLAHGNTGTESDFFASLTGPAGPQGEQGPAGADGAQGPQGEQGPAGADGAQGPQGEQGPAGADGAQGPQGEPGPAGADGAEGPQGEQGPAGADGAEGPQGEQGPAGADGAQGPQGEQGLQGEQGPAGADGASAYDVWLGLGNEGTEEDFIAYLSGGQAFSPSSHGVFDSETDGTTFAITEAVATVSIELWGASGGSGGNICGQTLGASSCNLCDGSGGQGGRALKAISMIYNLAQGDVLELIATDAGADSGELITCNPGATAWTNWDCGPASSGADAGTTQLLLNGEVIAEISGGTGGTGACIGCQGDGCFNGDSGSNGELTSSANWMTVLSTDTLEGNTGSRVIIRY